MRVLDPNYLSECFVLTDKCTLVWKSRPCEHFKSISSHKRWNTIYSGKPAGYKGHLGYFKVKVNGITLLVHRIVWCLVNGELPPFDIDHRDGDVSNNDISNLRLCKGFNNQKNRKTGSNNTSGQMGVLWRAERSRWISVYWSVSNGKRKTNRLGSFKNYQDAVDCRLKWESENGFDHRHNSCK